MSESDRDEVVALLIELGRNGPNDELKKKIPKSYRFRLGPLPQTVFFGLTNRESFDFFRGVVLAEDQITSVSPAILLARSFSERCPELYWEATEWLQQHCRNPWVKLHQSPYYDYLEQRPLTKQELLAIDQRRRQAEKQARQHLAEEEAAVRVRRAERIAAARENRRLNLEQQAISQSNRRKRLAELVGVAPVERLLTVVTDLGVGLDYYPPEWGHLDAVERQRLPADAVALLMRRSQFKTGRTWRDVAALFRTDARQSPG